MKQRISELVLSCYIYLASCLIGWQFWSFISIYWSAERQYITRDLPTYVQAILYPALTVLLLTIIAGCFVASLSPFSKKNILRLLLWQSIYCLGLLMNHYMYSMGFHLDITELFISIMGLYIIYLMGAVFYRSTRIEFQHPTTYGTFVTEALLFGLSCYALLPVTEINIGTMVYGLLILILLNLSVFFARFKFLSAASRATNRVARQLLGPKLIYFGSRIIIGFFIPLVLLISILFQAGRQVKEVAVLILFGGLIEKMLFVMIGSDRNES